MQQVIKTLKVNGLLNKKFITNISELIVFIKKIFIKNVITSKLIKWMFCYVTSYKNFKSKQIFK